METVELNWRCAFWSPPETPLSLHVYCTQTRQCTLSDIAEKNSEFLAAVETLDSGKAISLARGDVAAVVSTLRYYAGWADKLEGKTIDIDPDMLHYTRPEPLGVCIVMKTAEQTPLSALVFTQFNEQAGFPAGVFNLVSGFGRVVGAAISSHMGIDKIMKEAAASNLMKVTLELGGKSPNVIFNDADIESAVTWANIGIYYNQGQTCAAGSRILVQEGIYDKFVATFKERTLQNEVGDPFDEQSFQGPQISQLQYDRIMGYIKSGKEEGATLVTGGGRVGTKGFFILPTIFTDVGPDMKIMREEIFGPVCAIAKFKDEAEAIQLANDTNFALASAVHTTNLDTAIRVSNAIEAGTVWINCYNKMHFALPVGGFKESGIGQELGEAALANYTQNKSVAIQLQPKRH
ncbi:Aldehyde/histidinol dehydrogenase [Fusarium oxysporum Fo47]|nr:Aldehyde/histidinol dehydrogenase [Fusarium oxysporum Fo47]QKD57401.2 Aldehyde/histidinol dehydrogenase [Fusarium oxysporum Fo47]